MRHTVARLLPVFLMLLFVACSSDVDDDVGPSADDEATAAETAVPTTEENVRADEEESASTPAPLSVEEWLETAPTFQGVAQGPDGELYVGYPRHAAILVLSPDGELIDAWGEEVRLPNDIAADADTIYVADISQINRYDSDGSHLGTVGEFGFEPGQLAEPFGITLNSDGNLFVTEAPGGAIKKFSPEGESIEEWADPEDGAVRPGTFLASDSDDNLYLISQADQEPFTIQVRTADQDVVDEWELPSPRPENSESNQMSIPMGIAVGGDDLVHVATVIVDSEAESREMVAADYHLSTFNQDGDLISSWLAVAESDVEQPLGALGGMTITQDGHLIIVDAGPGSHRIQRFTVEGEFLDDWELDVPEFLCGLGPDEFEGLTC